MTGPPFDALLPVRNRAVVQDLRLTLQIDGPTREGGCRIGGEVAGGRRAYVEVFGKNPTVELLPFVRPGITVDPIGGATEVWIIRCTDRHQSYPVEINNPFRISG
jgi:hypothetical protein